MSLAVPEPDGVPERPSDRHLRMRTLLTKTNPTAFNDDDIRAFYVDYFLSLCAELEHVPGYGLAMEAVAERYAFLVAQMKAFDTQEAPLLAQQYERLILRFTQLFDRLLKGRDDRTADDAFKRQFTSVVIEAVAQAVEESVPDRQEANELLANIAGKLRAVQNAERGAPSGTGR